MQRAKDVMTPNPHCCFPDSTIYEAALIMKSENCGIVPVINQEGACISVVTDRDLCLITILEYIEPETKLQEIIEYQPITCRLDETVDDVIAKMEKYMIRRIPVIDDLNKCVGIISEADIALKVAEKNKLVEFIEKISS